MIKDRTRIEAMKPADNRVTVALTFPDAIEAARPGLALSDVVVVAALPEAFIRSAADLNWSLVGLEPEAVTKTWIEFTNARRLVAVSDPAQAQGLVARVVLMPSMPWVQQAHSIASMVKR